jgi:hypothetical protein
MRFIDYLPGGLIVAFAAVHVGCTSGPGRLSSPDVNAGQAAAAAVEEFDSNGDGLLQPEEIKSCPALVDALGVYDADHDGDLTVEEIKVGINHWAASRTGAMMLPFRVSLDGRPLADAEVKLVPVSFLADSIKPNVGKADASGSGMLGLAPEDRPSNAPPTPLATPGLYRVEITDPSGKVPAQYNTESTLGIETFVASRNPGGVSWDLQTKKK